MIRDEHGAWVRGYTANLGSCGVEETELWSVWHGLSLTWDLNITKFDLILKRLLVGY